MCGSKLFNVDICECLARFVLQRLSQILKAALMMSFICRIILPFMAAIAATAQLGGTEPSLITVSCGPVASKFKSGHVTSTLHSFT
jgi:hypothetical protein